MKSTLFVSRPILFVGAFIIIILCFIQAVDDETITPIEPDLYAGFQNPPAEARPFVRWWWNGNKIREDELLRELEVLKKAKFGGVEINSIAFPDQATDNGDDALVWMSDEWIDRLVAASKKAKDLGMITDLIVGTGWPFGGEFLKDEQTSQRMVTHRIDYVTGDTINIDEGYLIQKYLALPENKKKGEHENQNTTYDLSFVKLVPKECSGTDQVIDLFKKKDQEGNINDFIVGEGDFQLSYGLVERNFKSVYLGAPGGAGPVMDHYKKEVTRAYLYRLKRISERTGISLSELIRALFCDSIEISGANWTDDFAQIFNATYGYALEDWLPFVFYRSNANYLADEYEAAYSPSFRNELKRVRFDYNRLLVEVFLAHFTQEFKDFCAENDVLCRYQAYGVPFLMGVLNGYLIPDIPESNNWIYSAEMKDSVWQWNQDHGYMIWNMYAAAGGHLAGRKIISVEAMTNLKGVFRTTLEEIKQHDDMNFITGMNHSILHGFNYSPPEVESPGWIRYGAFFSELNPWWKHIHHWVDYNARLSYIFQNTQAEKKIAIIGPTHDLWGDEGLGRRSFHIKPKYLYKMWEPISQLGYSCEYINQNILEDSKIGEGRIEYGPMAYEVLILASMQSVTPKAMQAVERFLASGGTVIAIDQLPDKSSSYVDYENADQEIEALLDQIMNEASYKLLQVQQPEDLESLFEWTRTVLQKANVAPDLRIDHPSQSVFQIHQTANDKNLYFFTNAHRERTQTFKAEFPVTDQYPWKWDPKTGERTPFPFANDQEALTISLKPLESLLLVFEAEKGSVGEPLPQGGIKEEKEINGQWNLLGQRVDGAQFDWNATSLIDLSHSQDPDQQTFAGDLTYRITVDDELNGFTHFDLGEVNEGVSTLFVNGEEVGTRWYGEAIYPIAEFLSPGANDIEIRYTGVINNYYQSQKNNNMAQRWTDNETVSPMGIEGPVRFLCFRE